MATRDQISAGHDALIVDAEGHGIDGSGRIDGRVVRAIFDEALREARAVHIVAGDLVPIVDAAGHRPIDRARDSEEGIFPGHPRSNSAPGRRPR